MKTPRTRQSKAKPRTSTQLTKAKYRRHLVESSHYDLNNVPAGIFITDISGKLIYANELWCKITGLSLDAAMKDGWLESVHPLDKENLLSAWTKPRSDYSSFETTFRILRKDGSRRFIQASVNPNLDPLGGFTGFLSAIQDITLFKHDLKQAQRKSKQADLAKTDFLSMMSHEVRTPLNGIIGTTNLLLETRLEQDQREYSEAISQSGKSLLTIINDILDFSKIDAGQMKLEQTEFNLNSYLRELLESFQYSAKKKGIDMDIRLQEYPYLIFGDAGRIGQIATHLVSNAIKFTKKGGVIVSTEFENQGSKTVFVLKVYDSGIGIPEAATKRMFQAFSQVESSTSRSYGGTGIGLSISKRLVDLMQGNITFESDFKMGTVFTVTLKFETGGPITLPLHPENSTQSDVLFGRVLIAEDNPTNQIIIARMIEKWGCRYHIVSNGNEVLDSLRETPYDLILMDCQMPEMDGYTTAKIIRKSQTMNNAIPIIALTANAIKGDDVRCREAGMNDYLTKPIDRRMLKSRLIQYLQCKMQYIDVAIIEEFKELQMDGMEDILISTIDTFLETSSGKNTAIVKFLSEGDRQAASREAHSLKSSAQILGAMSLGKVCQEIENLFSMDSLRSKALDYAQLRELGLKVNEYYSKSCIELVEVKKNQIQKNTKKSA